MLAKRKMASNVLAEKIGMNTVNMSRLKTGKIRAIKIETLNKICEVLDCKPNDILDFSKDSDQEFI